MSMFPAYTVGSIDQLIIHDYRALIIHGAELKAEERRSRIVDMAFAVRLGMADAEQYESALNRLTNPLHAHTSNQEPLTLGDKLFTEGYVQASLTRTEQILTNLRASPKEEAINGD